MNQNGFDLSDVAAVTKNNDGFGNSGLWVLLFLVIVMGWGGNGWGGNAAANAIGYENLATSNEVQRGFDNQNSMANQREILAAVNNGTSQSVAATNQTFHDTWSMVSDKYGELQRDITNVAMAAQGNQANQQQCCTSVLRAIDGVNYQNAQNTASINATTTAQAQRLLDYMTGQETQRLRDENMTLKYQQYTGDAINRQAQQNQAQFNALNSQMQLVPKAPVSMMYNAGPSPFCNCNCGGVQ